MQRVAPPFSMMMALLLTAALFVAANPAVQKPQPRFGVIEMNFGACYYCWHRHIPEPTKRDLEKLRDKSFLSAPPKPVRMYPAPPGWNRA